MKSITKRLLASVVSISMLASVAFADANPEATADIVEKIDTADVFNTADLLYTWDDEAAIKVNLADGNITVDGSGATASGSVLTITEAGTYVLSGSLSNGQITVNNKEADIRIVLNGVNISSDDASPIFIDGANNAYITVAEGTVNTVTDKNLRANSKQDAVIFAEDDLTINGTGTLNVTAAYKLAIHSENDLTVCGTVLNADSSVSANSGHAVLGEDSVCIKDANLTVKSANDGIQSKTADEGKGNIIIENANISIESANDGIQAEHAFQSSDSTLKITTQAGDGIKAVDSVYIDGENTFVEVNAFDGDGIKTDFVYDATLAVENGNIQIMNGNFKLDVSKDGIQASAEALAEDAVTVIDSKASLKVFKGKFDIKSGGEALKVTDTITVLDGEFNLSTKGDAILSENDTDTALGIVNVLGGKFGITTEKDAIQAQSQINIAGGDISVTTLETAFDSDGSITVSGGSIALHGSNLDTENVISYGENASALINSGKLIALDNALSPITFSEQSEQPIIVLTFEEGIAVGTVFEILDSENNIINTITSENEAKNLFVSDPALSLNGVYGFNKNGENLGWTVIDKNIFSITATDLTQKPSTPMPTAEATLEPTLEPTVEPTIVPTVDPTVEPTVTPTEDLPTAEPTLKPTIEPTVEPTVQPEFELGDLNGDGKVNSKDIAAMQKHITEAKLLEDEMLVYADLSGDGKVNSRDIALLQRKILG